MLQQFVEADVERRNHAEDQPNVSIAVFDSFLTTTYKNLGVFLRTIYTGGKRGIPTSQLRKQREGFAKQLQTNPMA